MKVDYTETILVASLIDVIREIAHALNAGQSDTGALESKNQSSFSILEGAIRTAVGLETGFIL